MWFPPKVWLPNMGTKTKSNCLLRQLSEHKIKHCKYWTLKVHEKDLTTLHNESKINKLKDIICHFLYDQLKNNLPETFSNFFTLNTQLHQHNTRKNRFNVPNANMTSYGSNSITLKAIKQWNKVQKFINIDIYHLYSSEITYSKFLKSVLKYIESQ